LEVAALVSSAERLDGAVGAVGAAGIAETWEQGCTDPDGDSSGVVIGKTMKASDTGGEHGRDGGRLGTQVGDIAISSGLMVLLRSGMGSPKMVRESEAPTSSIWAALSMLVDVWTLLA
jgi:hypothetical protein